MSEQSGGCLERPLHGFVVRIHDRCIQSAGQRHGEEGAVDERPVRQTEGNVGKAHGRRVSEFAAVELKRAEHFLTRMDICRYGHDQCVEQKIAVAQSLFFC